ncbi:MAG: hypothetical protein OEY19_02065 [Gammaproteobacteria bacterium]|nr:hypothetical protein [Gammaproteobacteria bacterium]MDH5628738.1 hypothetical protein [Gammaproteobacteria bacterium]
MSQKTAILICGFSNWGKNTVIQNLFGKTRFAKTTDHKLHSKPFSVIQYENKCEEDFLATISDIVNSSPNRGKNIIAAIQPTKEDSNNSSKIIQTAFKDYNVHIIYLVNKWDGTAQLIISNIMKFYGNSKIKHIPITATSLIARQKEVDNAVKSIVEKI